MAGITTSQLNSSAISSKSAMCINQLDDDCLLAIFANLAVMDKLSVGVVCRRWRQLDADYNLFHDQVALGTVRSASCMDTGHHITKGDVIATLFTEDGRPPRTVQKGTFNVTRTLRRRQFSNLLAKCPELRSLVLKFCTQLHDDAICMIAAHCPRLEHLDCSQTLFGSETVLNCIGQRLSALNHINIVGCEPLDETQLSLLLHNCSQLREFAFGRNGKSVTGSFLQHFVSDVQCVSIYGIDEFAAMGMPALAALASGRGKSTEHLKLKGQLSVDLIRRVVQKFPLLKSIALGDFFRDAWIDGTHSAIGTSLAQLTQLEHLSLELPQLIQMDGNICAMMRGCIRLRAFRMQGGPISDATVQLLCKWCPHLEQFALVYDKAFPSQVIRPTGVGLEALVNLKNLKLLALNGTHITDNAFSMVITGCEQLVAVDVRDSPELTNCCLNAIFEAAMSRPNAVLRVFTYGTQIEYDLGDEEDGDDVLMPPNLRLLLNARDYDEDDGDDVEFEGEEFEYYEEQPERGSGVVFSDAYVYNQPEDCIRYCLEDLEI